MKIVGQYAFNDGLAYVEAHYTALLKQSLIPQINAADAKTKISQEKTMPGRLLYSPKALNKQFEQPFYMAGWQSIRVPCEYPTEYYVNGYNPPRNRQQAFREIDFVKEKLGIEVQCGKYAFMVYNVCAKMTIFHNLGIIDAGIEIVPVKEFAEEMSSGVSYFEQFVWDLEQRGIANIDIPVLILGIK